MSTLDSRCLLGRPAVPDGRRTKCGAHVLLVAVVAFGLSAAGCSASGQAGEGNLVTAVASYDIVADRPSRFIVGLYTVDQSRTLAFGTVSFSFTYLGEGNEPEAGEESVVGPVEARFLPIPGQDLDPNSEGPTLAAGSVATGVYSAPVVDFDRAGFWEVAVTAVVDGSTEVATGAFEVLSTSAVPAVGSPAPMTRQPLADDTSVDPESIDSRAGGDSPVPDPDLHDITVADAISARTPAMVVVSTPTFCVSRFCGPITDTVEELSSLYGDRMEFIHLEVWQDFAANRLNPAAAEWIAPTPDAGGAEPWVFVIDDGGTIVQRFDNVASEAELLTSVQAVLGEGPQQ